MELLSNIAIDFILFGVLEALILCMFFVKIGECEKITVSDMLVIALFNTVISKTLPPVLYQIVIILMLALFINKIELKKYRESLYISLSSMIYIMVIEMLYSIVTGIFMTNGFDLSGFALAVYMIPVRFIEVLIIIYGGDKMKLWLGEIKKPVKTK